MKAINTNINITSISSRRDKSIRFSAETPELTSKEKVAFMDLQNLNVDAYFKPVDFSVDGGITVEKELDGKSPSQRLRGALWVWWDQKYKGKIEFNDFYSNHMEKIIDQVKDNIDS